ncbi:MAG: hypothetical protein AAGJ28_24955 [Pseudomonadota bacterium]
MNRPVDRDDKDLIRTLPDGPLQSCSRILVLVWALHVFLAIPPTAAVIGALSLRRRHSAAEAPV